MGNRNKKIAPVELRQHKNCVDGMVVTARNSGCEKNHCALIFLNLERLFAVKTIDL